MSKAEERAAKKALETFPILFSERMGVDKTNLQQERRNAYEKGYHQAEKDLELTWEDMMAIDDLLDELLPPRRDSDELVLKGYYEEILKRFKDYKERKEK